MFSISYNLALFDRLQGLLFSVFQDRMNVRKEILELEGSERDMQFKVHLKEKALTRMSLVFSDPTVMEKVCCGLFYFFNFFLSISIFLYLSEDKSA